MDHSIPELSFKDIERGDVKSIDSLKLALSDHGFFAITNHGLSTELLDDCYKSSKDFFNLDTSTKLEYNSKSSKGARGYTPSGIETAVGEKIADQKEFWHHGPIVDSSYESNIPSNISINEIKDFNKNFDELYLEMHSIGMRVMSVIASSIGLSEDYFSSWILKGNSLLRSIYYPPIDDVSNLHRARAHEDINLITLLVGAEEGGLEVLNKKGDWIKVKPSSNSIVCNIGDMMQLVTDKKLKSTTHRVIQYQDQRSKPRYSIPFFLHPAPSVVLKSVFNNEDEGVLADDFLNERLKAIKLY
jgi:isopenicillin N synthase-like dioxygenase|tara:strand:- start:929 stop:1831 length:903 start_codon:yes stop_codon:yes gene_type:complete